MYALIIIWIFTLKRSIDFLFAITMLLLLAPLLCFLALMVWLTSPGPILYWSERVGRDNHPFKMPKFRSMKVEAPTVATHLLEDSAKWLTPIGVYIRSSSLDELPQLWCILIGDMSLVGPRPALLNQNDLIEQRTNSGVSSLPPGLTGWAQVNGRDELSISAKASLDAEYLKNQSLLLDFKILWLTLIAVIKRTGVTN